VYTSHDVEFPVKYSSAELGIRDTFYTVHGLLLLTALCMSWKERVVTTRSAIDGLEREVEKRWKKMDEMEND